ncbi:predicted protein [Uncinocarpus reesii 1704]|uniref:Tubulin-specific chaperone A n=1 Tax=Uncinocarpus reesii (strain UAMH 1704) TaxID=336963 RepID=C4JEJ8_UNCRE|nr:uncharacterized protein UREG_00837 [Uncinocarpus reesii 1704]EEP75990.1 predicted protein [Uncinocarpus reesii 1704]
MSTINRTPAAGLDPIRKAIKTLDRLVKEEASYHVELADQKRRIIKTEERIKSLGENAEEEGNEIWMLKQERMACAETERVLETMPKVTRGAMQKLEELVVSY